MDSLSPLQITHMALHGLPLLFMIIGLVGILLPARGRREFPEKDIPVADKAMTLGLLLLIPHLPTSLWLRFSGVTIHTDARHLPEGASWTEILSPLEIAYIALFCLALVFLLVGFLWPVRDRPDLVRKDVARRYMALTAGVPLTVLSFPLSLWLRLP